MKSSSLDGEAKFILWNRGGPDYSAEETIDDWRDNGDTWTLELESDLDEVLRILEFTFRTIDPDTGLLPTDADAGFLPPEDGTGRGKGYVHFRVRAASDLEDGVVINNSATIVFDTEEPIITYPPTLNTIGQHECSPDLTLPTITLIGKRSGNGGMRRQLY